MSTQGVNVVAELTFKKEDGSLWTVTVSRDLEEDTRGYWEAELFNGRRRFPLGRFRTGLALEKYVRGRVEAMFPQQEPEVDTLSRLRDRSPTSVIPDCYSSVEDGDGVGFGYEKCPGCPYRSACGPQGTSHPTESPPVTEETEDAFLKRLRSKVPTSY